MTACVPTKPGGTKPSTYRVNPLIAQASALAANHDMLIGPAKTQNGLEIERIVASLDNAALSSEAAMLREGDPLYNFIGRELLRRDLPLYRIWREGVMVEETTDARAAWDSQPAWAISPSTQSRRPLAAPGWRLG